MPWIALPFLFILNAGPSIYWGYRDAGAQAVLLWSAGIGVFTVLAGWRAPKKGVFRSILRGMCIAAAVNIPAYFVGRWLALLPLDCSSQLDSLFETAIKHISCGG